MGRGFESRLPLQSLHRLDLASANEGMKQRASRNSMSDKVRVNGWIFLLIARFLLSNNFAQMGRRLE
jgi:hypothetical protein